MMVELRPKLYRNEDDELETCLLYRVYDEVFTGRDIDDAEDTLTLPPKLVCRQFWSEASRIFLDSCVVRVSHQAPLLAFALSKQTMVQSVRKLMITYDSFGPSFFPQR